jgi:hypothetical protein
MRRHPAYARAGHEPSGWPFQAVAAKKRDVRRMMGRMIGRVTGRMIGLRKMSAAPGTVSPCPRYLKYPAAPRREGQMATRQTEHESDEAGREAARKATDQAVRSTRAMSDAAERTTRAGAEAAERGSERMLSSWRTGTATANRIAERSMDQFSRMFGLSGETTRQTLQQSSENVQAILETTTMMADSFQDLSGEWMRFVQSRAEHNLGYFDRLLGCRSLHEWTALQTQIARDHFEAFLESARKTSERSTQMAEQAARKMGETTLAPQ